MDISYRKFELNDFDKALQLWSKDQGLELGPGDSRSEFEYFVARNPDSSFVAISSGNLVGSILCGQDGRRGYIYHLYVAPDFRRRGIAQQLVNKSIKSLLAVGIHRCLNRVFKNNSKGNLFWVEEGWSKLENLNFYFKDH